jgi:hypothetical protein
MSETPPFPANWQIAADYDPNNHLMQLKGRDYLNVQNRLLWFIKDQRAFIAAGLATCPYVIETKLIDSDREAGYAQFSTYVRDVLGNESTMYGSETAKDFGDYAEKASTKSLGRALLNLGYGTAFAPEMDEGERVVDAPQERKRQPAPARPSNIAVIRDEPEAAPEAPAPAVKNALSALQFNLRAYGYLTIEQYHKFISDALTMSTFTVADWEKRGLFTEEHVAKLRDAFAALKRKAEEAMAKSAANQ